MTAKGVIAAGHPETARAAQAVLADGGNAFDAILSALFSACVAEPVLASLGGGGFMMTRTQDGKEALYDFFTQTPVAKKGSENLEFYPVQADFGATTQEFHIGIGSCATPGIVKGAFRIHGDLCSMPMHRIVEPACQLARQGVRVNELQSYIFKVVQTIMLSTPAARAIFGVGEDGQRIAGQGQTVRFGQLADTMDSLAREGEGLFYHSEIAQNIARDCQVRGGHLTLDDFESYDVVVRNPLSLRYRDASIRTNPLPSHGGVLIAFALKLLEAIDRGHFGSAQHLCSLARVMAATNLARAEQHQEDADLALKKILDDEFVGAYRKVLGDHWICTRGTTHISAIDQQGNMAGMTISNGEGSGYIIPGTGVMLNNMLGEEDLNPRGFHAWSANTRISSMMAPSFVLRDDGTEIVTGSGGSNRIRSAILQTLVNLIDFNFSPECAVNNPRIHFENNLLSVESGFDPSEIKTLADDFPNHELWDDKNIFFGGAHTACFDPHTRRFDGAGDVRRGGVCIIVN